MTLRSRLFAASLLTLTGYSNVGEWGGDLFDKVASTLEARYYDREFARDELPDLIERFRPRAANAGDAEAEREIVFEFLSHIPASHLGLMSQSAHRAMLGELFGEPGPTLGLELAEQDGVYFARAILEGSPAAEAGVLLGDVVVAIDGVAPADSPRLDWRTDDAALPDLPRHRVLVDIDETVELVIERSPGERETVSIIAARYPALRATRASAEVIEHQGAAVAYVHFWFIHHHTLDELLQELVAGPFADADALVLDLRGRGGSAAMVAKLVSLFVHGVWEKPLVVLIDSETRSGKEVLAYELKQRGIGRFVGRTTAGAVLPASFQPVGDDMILMFPAFPFGEYSTLIEGVGVEPDVKAKEAGPYAAGDNPIFDAGLNEAADMVERARASSAQEKSREQAPAAVDD